MTRRTLTPSLRRLGTPALAALVGCAAPLSAGCQGDKTSGTQAASESAGPAPATDADKLAYALGLRLGRSVYVFHLSDAELAFVRQGLEDAVKSRKYKVDLKDWGSKIDEEARRRAGETANLEQQRTAAFLEAAAKQPGVVKSESGMLFRSVRPGTGPQATHKDGVKIRFTNRLPDGNVIESLSPEESRLVNLAQPIPCWTETLVRMKVGEKAEAICPAEIAFPNDQGRPVGIPKGSAVVMEVELLEIVPQGDVPPLEDPPAQ